METQQPGCSADQTLQQETRVNIHSFIKHLVSRPYPEDDCIGGGDGQVEPHLYQWVVNICWEEAQGAMGPHREASSLDVGSSQGELPGGNGH